VKKGILLSILALGLVLGLAVPMATPAVIEAQTNPPGCLKTASLLIFSRIRPWCITMSILLTRSAPPTIMARALAHAT
jgi:hypothetical protein